jgi:hypothetical protein
MREILNLFSRTWIGVGVAEFATEGMSLGGAEFDSKAIADLTHLRLL